MKVMHMGIVVVIFSVLVWIAVPAWSQDQTTEQQSSEQPEAPTPAVEETQAAQPAIQIEDAVVCQEVVDRAPVGSSDVIAKESTKIYCYTRVVGAAGETQITHNWYYKGSLQASVVLDVRSSNWRTWSSKTMSPDRVGEWMVEILSEDGTPLESIIFFVQ
jgi:Tfp pilus assembly protein PilE